MNAKTVAITVAVIGAIATLGAAILSNSGKGKDQPAVQQTSSGEGAINVGHDAVINNVAKSAGEEAAERVQACEIQHGIKTAVERKDWVETIPAKNGEPEEVVGHTTFLSCHWPKSPYADGDGYLEIKVNSVTGPGDSEASGEDEADRITAPCPRLTVSYQYGHQGDFENRTPFTVSANTIVTIDGAIWTEPKSTLPFYPEQDEFVVLRSGHYMIGSAACQ